MNARSMPTSRTSATRSSRTPASPVTSLPCTASATSSRSDEASTPDRRPSSALVAAGRALAAERRATLGVARRAHPVLLAIRPAVRALSSASVRRPAALHPLDRDGVPPDRVPARSVFLFLRFDRVFCPRPLRPPRG